MPSTHVCLRNDTTYVGLVESLFITFFRRYPSLSRLRYVQSLAKRATARDEIRAICASPVRAKTVA